MLKWLKEIRKTERSGSRRAQRFRGLQFVRLEDRRMLASPVINPYAYFDANGDGYRGFSEPGIEGITIRLTDSAGADITRSTGSNGQVIFGPGWSGTTATLTVVDSLDYELIASLHEVRWADNSNHDEGPFFGSNSLTFENGNIRNVYLYDEFYFGLTPKIDLRVDTLDFDDSGNVQGQYTISAAEIPDDTKVSLYWSGGETFSSTIGPAIASEDIPRGTLAGTYHLNVASSQLANPPTGATHLLMILDPNVPFDPNDVEYGRVPESSEGNNLISLELLPDVEAKSLHWHANSLDPGTDIKNTSFPGGTGVDITYEVKYVALTTNVSVNLYWSDQPTFQGPGPQTVLAASFVADRTVDEHQKHILATEFSGDPGSWTRYLIVEVDPDDELSESAEDNNTQNLLSDAIAITSPVENKDGESVRSVQVLSPRGPMIQAVFRPAGGALMMEQANKIADVHHFNWLQTIQLPATWSPEIWREVFFNGKTALVRNELDASGRNVPYYDSDGFHVDEPVSRTNALGLIQDPIVEFQSGPGESVYAAYVDHANNYVVVRQAGDGEPFYLDENSDTTAYLDLDLEDWLTTEALRFHDEPRQPGWALRYGLDSLHFETMLVGVNTDGSPSHISADESSFRWTSNSYTEGVGEAALTGYTYSFDDGTLPPVIGGGILDAGYLGQPINHTPVLAELVPRSAVRGLELSFTAMATDADAGQTLTFSLDSPPTGATIDPLSGEFTWIPTADNPSGDHSITVRVTDDGDPSLSATQSFHVIIAPNDAPLAIDDSETTNAGVPVVIDVSANDTDPDGFLNLNSVTVVSPPTNGSVTVLDEPAAGAITYTPNSGFTGQDSFTYTIEDDFGDISDETTVTLIVTPVVSVGGPIFLTGDDADDSGHCQGTACGALYPTALNFVHSNSQSEGSGIVAIGVNGGAALSSLNSWNDPANGGPGAAVTHLRTTREIAVANFADFATIYIPSNDNNTFGGMTASQLTALNARQVTIVDFVNNRGGGVLALTESGDFNQYGWLPLTLTTVDVGHTGSNIFPTAEMSLVAPSVTSADLNHGCCYHSAFSGPPGFSGLNVLAFHDHNGNGQFDGESVDHALMLGGGQVTIQGNISLSPSSATPVGSVHTVTAAAQDGSPLAPAVDATVTFTVLAGPNVGVGGTGTTGTGGETTFTYFGTGGVGTDLVVASFLDQAGVLQTSNTVEVFWESVPNARPVADPRGPYTVNEGGIVILDGSGSTDVDQDPSTLLYEWDLDDDGIFAEVGLDAGRGDETGISPNFSAADLTGPRTMTVSLRVTDDFGLADIATATIDIINVAPDVTVDISTQDVQYSDSIAGITVTATDIAADTMHATTSWSTDGGVTFSNAPPLPDAVTIVGGLALDGASDQVETGIWVVNGIADLEPGPYVIRISIADEDLGSTDVDVTLNVLPEDADVTYTGPLFVSTTSINEDTAVVPLRAAIRDITAVSPGSDPNAGHITTANVKFVVKLADTDTIVHESPMISVELISDGDIKTGVAMYDWTSDIGNADSENYTVDVIVDGNYIGGSAGEIITVSKPLNNFTTGGGYLVNQLSAGVYAGDLDLKTNFGFNVKFNKRLTSLKGKFTVIIRQDGHTYKIKTNSLQSLVVNPDGTATLICKANLSDVTDPNHPLSLGGNLRLIVTLSDLGEPGTGVDTIGFELWGKNDLWFSSHWNAVQTVEQLLGGGNLQVRLNGKALLLADSQVQPSVPVQTISEKQLNPYITQAISAWDEDLVGHQRLNELNDVQVFVADLPGSQLGLQLADTIWIDIDAAGYGWSHNTRQNGVDLLTVLTHEFGHVLGFEHGDDHAVMQATLFTGQQWVPGDRIHEGWLVPHLSTDVELAASADFKSTIFGGMFASSAMRMDARQTGNYGFRQQSTDQLASWSTPIANETKYWKKRDVVFESIVDKFGLTNAFNSKLRPLLFDEVGDEERDADFELLDANEELSDLVSDP